MALEKVARPIVGLVLAVCTATEVLAQAAYPARPVRIVVPYSAGGRRTSTDASSATAYKKLSASRS